jgi:hypothetical protein
LVALLGMPPEPPIVTVFDGSRIVVRVAGTIPAPEVLAVERVEVQQAPGSIGVIAAAPTDSVVELKLVTAKDRLRLRWVLAGVGGPWSEWTLVVSGCMQISRVVLLCVVGTSFYCELPVLIFVACFVFGRILRCRCPVV